MNSGRMRAQNILLVLIIFGVIIFGLGWVNYQFSLNNPGGNDFLVHYIGTRALLFEGISPYSDQVAERIQTAAYGQPAGEGEHELRVAYPLYSVGLFAPFSIVGNYALARGIWMTFLEISLVGMTFVLFSLFEWHPRVWLQGVILFFTLTWYHAVRALVNGNAVVFVALLISLVFLAIKKEQDRAAGLMLALTTIKPHLVILVVPFILIWAIYQRRQTILTWFLASMAVFITAGILVIPNWILQNIWEILRYPGYNPAGTLGQVLAGWFPGLSMQLRWGVWILMSVILLFEWWTARKASFPRFLWAGMMILVISQWIGIQTDPGNFILLFPCLMMVVAAWHKRWKARGEIVVLGALLFVFISLWLLFILTLERSYQPIQNPVMFLPLPSITLVGLYWIKWWYVSPVGSIWENEL